jgi:hypothetical protein
MLDLLGQKPVAYLQFRQDGRHHAAGARGRGPGDLR